jgi:hypothetical protein
MRCKRDDNDGYDHDDRTFALQQWEQQQQQNEKRRERGLRMCKVA